MAERRGKGTGREAGEGARARPACPICGRPQTAEMRPFCSRRCADVDLGNWVSGRYAVPGEPVDPEDLDGDR